AGDACPVDSKSTDICRESNGDCDPEEVCNGTNNDCPADAKSSAGCRDSEGVCDPAEICDGVGDDCPADAKLTTECRASGGECDPAEVCNGTNNDCPNDAKSTALCRPDAGLCDIGDYCDGVNDDCPADEVAADSVQCNTSPYAPATQYQCSSEECGGTPEELPYYQYCNGTDNFCPTDNLEEGTWQDTGPCAPDELCDIAGDGTSYCAYCPQGCTGSTCNQCDTGDCCDGATHRYMDTSEQCRTSAEPGYSELGCSGDCGGQPQVRDYFRYCPGDSVDCDDSNLNPGGWTANGPACTGDQPCVSGVCQDACDDGCLNNACCECLAADPCCDDSTCTFLGGSTWCGTISTEYQCAGSSCGDDVESRIFQNVCTGDTGACTGSPALKQDWASSEDCNSDSLCEVDAGTYYCDECANGCNTDSCCACDPSDPCCDDNDCDVMGSGETCGLSSSVYQCSSICDGTAREGTVVPQCTGSTTTCDGMSSPTWTSQTPCSSTQICDTNGTSYAQCNNCNNPPGADYCDSGNAYHYANPGTCTASACDYGPTEEVCVMDCSNGNCGTCATVAVDSFAYDNKISGTSFEFDHSLVARNDNDRIVIAGVVIEHDNVAEKDVDLTVTYDGIDMVKIADLYTDTNGGVTRYEYCSLWYILDANLPASADTYEVGVSSTFDPSDDYMAGAVSYTGVDQSAPYHWQATTTTTDSVTSIQ
ncbi:MAG: hypothetical protein GY842_00690, partial [bacterium]|nr:hypothetical protein [bacterium]